MENYSIPFNCSFLEKTEIYVIIAFFLFGGIQMTFAPQGLQATLCATACLSVIVSVMFAILSPLSTGKRLQKAFALMGLTILGAVLGGSLCLLSLPLTLVLITWNLYRENPDSDTCSVQEHEQNIKSLNIAYLIVAVLCFIVFAGVQMFQEVNWGNGLDLIAAYVWKEIHGGTWDNDTESQMRFYKALIVLLSILAVIVTPLASFQFSNRKKSNFYILSLLPSYVIVFLASSMTEERGSRVEFMELFALGSHLYFILSHISALIAIARDREVKLLLLQEGGLTKAESVIEPSEDNTGVLKKDNYGITGFILAVIYLVVVTIVSCSEFFDIHVSSLMVDWIMVIFALGVIFAPLGVFDCMKGARKDGRHRKLALVGLIIWSVLVLIFLMGVNISQYIIPALKV
jgi:hypothetical protein